MSFPLSASPPAPLSGQESGLAGDVPARIASLHVYPVKSCAGLAPLRAPPPAAPTVPIS